MSNLQLKVYDSCFCAPVGLLLANLNHYFKRLIHTSVFWLFKVTLKVGDTVPLTDTLCGVNLLSPLDKEIISYRSTNMGRTKRHHSQGY